MQATEAAFDYRSYSKNIASKKGKYQGCESVEEHVNSLIKYFRIIRDVRREMKSILSEYGIPLTRICRDDMILGKNQIFANGAIVLAFEDGIPRSFYTPFGELPITPSAITLGEWAQEGLLTAHMKRFGLMEIKVPGSPANREVYRLMHDANNNPLPVPIFEQSPKKRGAHFSRENIWSRVFARACLGEDHASMQRLVRRATAALDC